MTVKTKYIPMYLDLARTAAKYSAADRKKTGCVIVKDDSIIDVGINGTPPGWESNVCEFINHAGELETKPETIHAEENVMAKISKSSRSSDGAWAFITMAPCYKCAGLLFRSGIKKVFYIEPYRKTDGIEYLQKAGIEVIQFDMTNY